MAKCSVCGEKGLFLRVNASGRCKACEEKIREEKVRKENERVAFEKSCLESQEKEGLFPISLHSYVVTDIETSGLDCNVNSIIEISAIKVLNGEVVDNYSSLVHRESNLDPKIEALTGITTGMLKECPKTLDTVIKEYSDFIGEYPLIGHNISKFDILFIERAYKKALGVSVHNKCVDTLPLSKEYIRDSWNYKLQTLATHLNLSTNQAHRALSDCETTLELYKVICRIAKEKDVERERLLAEVNDPNSEIGGIMQAIRSIFEESDCAYLRYTKNKSYLRFKCYYDIFRIKISGRIKNYIVFAEPYENDILKSTNLETGKATSSDGNGKTRIFFETVEGLLSLKDAILGVYQKQKQSIQELIEVERKVHSNDNSGFFRIVWEEDEEPHFEKSVESYLNDKELFKV